MRVIAGTYRSRLLVSPPGTGTRPTSDRLRETLFNILSSKLRGSRFVDLYAGTGAVGIEALSRGAEHVWFAEKAEPALKALQANLATLKISRGFTLERRGTGALLERMVKSASSIDLVFLDPPYNDEDAYTGTLGLLGSATGRKVLAPEAVVIAEHATLGPIQLAARYGVLQQTRVYKQGDTTLSFYAPI